MACLLTTQADGSVESVVERRFRPDVIPVPTPGSVVVVTEKDITDHTDSVQRLAVLAQVIGALATLVVVARR